MQLRFFFWKKCALEIVPRVFGLSVENLSILSKIDTFTIDGSTVAVDMEAKAKWVLSLWKLNVSFDNLSRASARCYALWETEMTGGCVCALQSMLDSMTLFQSTWSPSQRCGMGNDWGLRTGNFIPWTCTTNMNCHCEKLSLFAVHFSGKDDDYTCNAHQLPNCNSLGTSYPHSLLFRVHTRTRTCTYENVCNENVASPLNDTQRIVILSVSSEDVVRRMCIASWPLAACGCGSTSSSVLLSPRSNLIYLILHRLWWRSLADAGFVQTNPNKVKCDVCWFSLLCNELFHCCHVCWRCETGSFDYAADFWYIS